MAKPRVLELNGESGTLRYWSDKTGICSKLLRQRLHDGWSIERTLTEPQQPWRTWTDAELTIVMKYAEGNKRHWAKLASRELPGKTVATIYYQWYIHQKRKMG